ncbi:uncharacterized protein BCR38DRAFT_514943 [Pseudomassariella vexata]|uniref:Uncharacterized protein n=1 Tax=Pseudomassariella vexata TaxID=1141098 RepID=A0A1Y2DY70_9PEZI|nr:uncharacterized protein BCR38DRAFT_514943 [Pseudomassariella vexata]ORY64159.1 hypothetical protein BCR38DRAFT_514943 [Pseudomassariella vexata]
MAPSGWQLPPILPSPMTPTSSQLPEMNTNPMVSASSQLLIMNTNPVASAISHSPMLSTTRDAPGSSVVSTPNANSTAPALSNQSTVRASIKDSPRARPSTETGSDESEMANVSTHAHTQSQLYYPINDPSFSQSKVWVSDGEKYYTLYERCMFRMRHQRMNRSPAVPKSAIQYVELKRLNLEAKIRYRKQQIKTWNKDKEARERANITGSHADAPFSQRLLDVAQADGRSTVLALEDRIWHPNAADNPQAEWPTFKECKAHGDDAAKHGIKPRLPHPRTPKIAEGYSHLAQSIPSIPVTGPNLPWQPRDLALSKKKNLNEARKEQAVGMLLNGLNGITRTFANDIMNNAYELTPKSVANDDGAKDNSDTKVGNTEKNSGTKKVSAFEADYAFVDDDELADNYGFEGGNMDDEDAAEADSATEPDYAYHNEAAWDY